MNDADAINSLNSWQPTSSLPTVTSRFGGADAPVTLKSGKSIGSNIALQPTSRPVSHNNATGMTMTLQQSGCQSSPSHHATDKFINVSPTKVHPHSLHTISAPTRFSPIPRMKVVQHKNGGPVTNNRTVNPNSDGTNPWYTAAVPVSGQEIGQSGGGGRSPLEGGKPTEPISPAHTRIFNSSSASPQDLSHSRLYQPSPPKGMGGRDEGAERERRKFNCCRQVMDILEKQEKKLKNTFNHGEGGENSVKVRSNHTVTELTGVLRDLGAKVDENEIQEAFRGAGDASGGITFSQLSAISTDTVYPGSNNGHADFFDVPKRDGKRVGVGPGAKHNGYNGGFMEHNMRPGARTELTFVERAEQEERIRAGTGRSSVDTHSRLFPQQVGVGDSGGRRMPTNSWERGGEGGGGGNGRGGEGNAFDDHNSTWVNKTVGSGPRLGLGGGKKAFGGMMEKVTHDSMNDIVFHGKYEEQRPSPVSKVQYSPSFNAPFANADNTPADY